MGQNQTNPFREGGQIMNDYQIQQRIPELFLTSLKHKKSNQQYILRQLTFNQLRQFTIQLQKLQKRKQLKHNNVTNLQIVQDRTEDQMCSNFFKIYTLWQYPKKCLMDDIATRTLENKPYSNIQLWTLLESCANGLAFLQQKGFVHECLTSKIILIDENNNIKVADPLSYGLITNLQYVLSNRYNKSIYLSPQQCECIKTQRPIINKNTYKNDVYTLALVILQAALLEKQDKCYIEDCSAINQTVITKNIAKTAEKYGLQLKAIIQIMTDQSIQNRPDWIGLQKVIHQIKNNKKILSKTQNKPIIKKQPIVSQQYKTSQRSLPRYLASNTQGLPTILSVSNQGGSSLRQNSTLVNNVSSIPPFNYVSQVGANSNTANKQFEFSQKPNQTKTQLTQLQPIDNVSTGSNNPNFLPVYSNMPKSPSTQQGINFKYTAAPVTTNQHPIDMAATFGSNRTVNVIPPLPSRQVLSPNPITTFRKLNEKEQILFSPINKPPTFQNNRGTVMGLNNLNNNQQVVSPRNIQNKSSSRFPPYQYPDNEPVYIEQRFAKGSRYEGYKLKGMRHGQGKFFYQDGGRYEGQWKQNKMNGFGKLFYQSDKIAYEGEWVNDQFHGWGKLYNQNPIKLSMGFDYRNFDQIQDFWDYYEGYFTQDLKNGKGKLRFSNGQLFQGTFADDMVQGQGVFSCKDGQVVHAIWMENHLVQLLN